MTVDDSAAHALCRTRDSIVVDLFSTDFVDLVGDTLDWVVYNSKYFIDCPVCGDADGSGSIDISDAVRLISYIFAGGSAPFPLTSGDANCDAVVDVSDAVYLITYIFAGGPAPCCP